MAPKQKNWAAQLQKLEGYISREDDAFKGCYQSPSPSFNFIWGKSHGLPRGASVIMYGPNKSGKTLMSNAMVGHLHRKDPEAIAIKFDTEFRESFQASPTQLKNLGIDPARYIVYETSSPMSVFDPIDKQINALCQEGAPIKLIIIDSITGIRGRRSLNADTVETQQIGDDAKTLQDGLKLILPVIRRHKISLILTSQARAEMDQLEQKRGKKIKPSVSWAVKHFAEYTVYVSRNESAEGRGDLLGNQFANEAAGDLKGNAEATGHKINFKMQASSCGPAGRFGETTFDYSKGIINTHEEVFLLGLNRGLILKPNNVTYQLDGVDFRGKPAILEHLKSNPKVCDGIMAKLLDFDLRGVMPVERKVKDEDTLFDTAPALDLGEEPAES